MTTANAKDYLAHVKALADGELQEQSCAAWHDVKSTTFDLHPEHYRRRPKAREWWLIKYSDGCISISGIPVKQQNEFEVVHVREVTNE